MKGDIRIGKGKDIDENVILGYRSGRKIKDETLIIGDNAIIRSGSVIYAGTQIGDNFATGHNVVIREENKIGNNVSIWSNSGIDYGCIIGNNVRIHVGTFIGQFSIVEDDVFMAAGITFANDLCPPCTKCMKGPTIKKGVKIGINVSILPHVIIGEYSLIGSGSVVTKDIPPYSLVYGNPARVMKKVTDMKCKKGIIDRPYKYE